MGLSSIRSPDPVAASGTFLGVPRRRNVAEGYRCRRMCSEGAGLRRLDGHNLLLGEEAEALVRALVVADDEIGTVHRAGDFGGMGGRCAVGRNDRLGTGR